MRSSGLGSSIEYFYVVSEYGTRRNHIHLLSGNMTGAFARREGDIDDLAITCDSSKRCRQYTARRQQKLRACNEAPFLPFALSFPSAQVASSDLTWLRKRWSDT
jgi:hypothetical protein